MMGVALVLTLWASTASAVSMSHFSGAFGAAAQPGGASTFSLTAGYPINPSVVGSLLTGAVADDLLVNLAGYTGIVNGASGPVGISQIKFDNGVNHAVFDVSQSTLNQQLLALPNMGFFGVGFIAAHIQLNQAQTSPALLSELASFIPGGSLIITYNGIVAMSNMGNPNATFDFSPSASFSLVAVPEPPALVLGASGIVLAAGYQWRRRRTRRRQVEVGDETVVT